MNKRFAVAGAIVAIVVLGVAIASYVAATRRGHEPPSRPPLTVGDRVPFLTGTRLDKTPVEVTFKAGEAPAVLYVTTSWQMGPRNERIIEALSASQGFRFHRVLVHSASVPRGVKDTDAFKVIVSVSEEAQATYRMDETPQTLVIGAGGEVLKTWAGVFDEPTIADLQKYFNVTLPELPRDPYSCSDPRSGSPYSAGAVAKIEGEQRRCRVDGNWELR